ncbi:TPA: hypothetical protein ACTXXA_003700 [Legionella anisa]
MLIQDIQKALQEEIWSPAAVQAVLASKANKRQKKGMCVPPAYSLDVSKKDSVNVNFEVLDRFVEQSYAFVKKMGSHYVSN